MRADLVSWRPVGASSSAAASSTDARRAPLASYVALSGAALAFALLIAFYWVVSALVQRAENGREQARLAVERQVVCGAFGNASSRALCASTVAARVPTNAVLRASYEPPSTNGPKRHLSAGMH